MDKFQIAVEATNEIANEATQAPNDIRTLQDVELLLAGGGSDGGVIWG